MPQSPNNPLRMTISELMWWMPPHQFKGLPGLFETYLAYVDAVQQRADRTKAAFLICEATEEELAEALRGLAYLRADFALMMLPGIGAIVGVTKLAGRIARLRRRRGNDEPDLSMREQLLREIEHTANGSRMSGLWRRTITDPDKKIGWGKGIPYEDVWEADGRLGTRTKPSNFPVVDFNNRPDGILTSIKTLDVNAKTYRNKPSAILYSGRRYLRKLRDFESYGQVDVLEYDTRQMILAIPEGANEAQLTQLLELAKAAANMDIELIIEVVR